jgi:hypothetical protein
MGSPALPPAWKTSRRPRDPSASSLSFSTCESLRLWAGYSRARSGSVPTHSSSGSTPSYGVNYPDHYLRAATFADRIFKGTPPEDLPVERPTKFELVINLKTAKALGLTIPPSLLQRADQVIE